jgi:hypothetical protein
MALRLIVPTLTVVASLLPASQATAGEPRCEAAPAELRIQVLGADYQCQRIGCAGGGAGGSPAPTPTPIPYRVFCDGGLALQIALNDKVLLADTFSAKERCLRAAEQFRTTKGCFCGADFGVRCIGDSRGTLQLVSMGGSFNRIEACIDALQQIARPVEVKPR